MIPIFTFVSLKSRQQRRNYLNFSSYIVVAQRALPFSDFDDAGGY